MNHKKQYYVYTYLSELAVW